MVVKDCRGCTCTLLQRLEIMFYDRSFHEKKNPFPFPLVFLLNRCVTMQSMTHSAIEVLTSILYCTIRLFLEYRKAFYIMCYIKLIIRLFQFYSTAVYNMCYMKFIIRLFQFYSTAVYNMCCIKWIIRLFLDYKNGFYIMCLCVPNHYNDKCVRYYNLLW